MIDQNQIPLNNKLMTTATQQQILIINKINNPKQYRGSNYFLIPMKQKKKPTTPKPSPPIKLINVRTLQPQKNTASTNQKTYMTLDEQLRTFQNVQSEGRRESFKTRFSFNKKSTHERMEEHNLSPFSNDGRSASPKYRKTPQKLITPKEHKEVKFAINLKELQKKKPQKPKATSARQSYGSKKTSVPLNNNKTVALNVCKQQIQKKKPSSVNPKRKKLHPNDKQQKARIQFQNEFLSMMNNRIHKQKITEMSDQDLEGSIKKKKPNLQICILNSDNSGSIEDKKLKEKKQIVKTMKLKVMKNIMRDYPNLDVTEKKVMCAVIIVQRLWRQRKVKQFFEHYVTPKASPQCSFRESLQKEVSSNNSTMNLLTNHITKKQVEYSSCEAVKAPRKKPTLPQNLEQNFLIRQNSSESYHQVSLQNHNTSQSSSLKQQSKLNDRVTKLFQDSILPFQNDNQKIVNEASSIDQPSMIKFIECYREIKLSSKKQTRSKRNIFSLKESLSQKCLMQKYYTRIFSDRPQKDKPNNYELFSLNNSNINTQSLKQNQQSSIEIFKEINKHPDYVSPQKLLKKQEEDEQVWVRNQTSYSQETDSDELVEERKNDDIKESEKKKIVVDEIVYAEGFYKKNHDKVREGQSQIILSPKKEQPTEQVISSQPSCGIVINQRMQQAQNLNKISSQKPEYSLKSIHKVSQDVMNALLSQFFKQYIGFQQKQCLVKKHRSSRSKQEQEKQKKPRLPGIEITQQSITQYLDILIPYILTTDRQQVLKSLQLFHPSTYQKCHRVQSPVYELFEFAQQQEDDIYWNIITNEGFFMCLEDYWKRNVTLTKEKEKFTNFLDLTYKVYNRCITDAFSQLFNKQVLEKIVYPWNKSHQHLHNKNKIQFSQQAKSLLNSQLIQTIASEVKQKLLKQSFCYSTTGGKLMKKDRKEKVVRKEFEFGQVNEQELMIEKLSDDQFAKVMKIADDQFLEDEKELRDCVDERYELKADVSQGILEELMKEIESELLWLQQSRSSEQPALTKSQQEVFLQTNQTLQTNYHF